MKSETHEDINFVYSNIITASVVELNNTYIMSVKMSTYTALKTQ